MPRIELKRVIMASGLPPLIRGGIGTINRDDAEMWLEDGLLFMRSRRDTIGALKVYLPIGFEMTVAEREENTDPQTPAAKSPQQNQGQRR